MSGGVDAWFGVDGAIARRLGEYEERPEQRQLARAIERALASGRSLCAEAGTGVGKSFAYLLPAVLHAVRHPDHGPVVVSTRTIALQEQLERKDLPFLQSVLPMEWSVVTAVGRNNYLCLRRMHLAQRERGVLFPDAAREAQLVQIVDWALTTREGTRMALSRPVDDPVWDEVRAEHGNCLHKACRHYDECPYQRSRRRMESASILVVNHALYMADVALRMAGAAYLPQHRVVIFDEAHHLPRVATESLGLRIGRGSVAWHLQRLRPRRSRHGLLDRHGSPGALRLVDELRDAANCFFQDLDQRIAKAGGSALALGDERLRDPLSGGLRELADELIGSATAVESIDLRMEIQARARGLAALQAVLHTLCQPTDRTRVRWLEPTRTGTELRAAPLEVGEALRQFVFVPGRTAVLTSATLGPGNDPTFAWIRDQLGLTDIDCLRLGSPFDYRRLVRLSLEEAMPDPGGDPSGFARACRERIPPLVIQNGGRALILCTSWTSVRDIAAALREPLAEEGIPLLVQGEAPLRHLLERKRGEPTSVLVGTDSLWEGIDVPGEALTLLVVTRFPFAQPDHPLTRARLRAIEARGGSGFADHTLPEAVLKFRQGFGRLVRTATDRGTVVVMDPRARTRAYGRQFLTALPDGVTPVGVEEPTGSE